MNDPRILIIEDDDFQYEIYEEALGKYQLVRSTTASEALKALAGTPPNVIILDHILAKGELGLEYLAECGEAEVVRQFEALERSRRVDVQELLSRSTDRLSRQTQIRQMLAATDERPNISALARRFKVARRTIIRDLQELIRRGELPPEVYPRWQSDAEDEAGEKE